MACMSDPCTKIALERALLAAQGYIELDMPTEALGELDSLSPADQEREEALHLRLFVLLRGRLWMPALALCSRMREALPDGIGGYIHGAFCLHEMGRTAEARDLLLSGPESLSKEATYFYNLGCYDAVLGNFKEAVDHLHVSFRMDKKFSEIAKYDPDLKPVRDLL